MAWNGSDGTAFSRKSSKKTRKSPIWRGLFAALLVVCGAAAAFWVLQDNKSIEQRWREFKTRRIAEDDPDLTERQTDNVVEEKATTEKEDAAKRERREKLLAMSPAERIEFLFEEAEARPLNLEPASNRVYATGTEQVLDWVFTTELGDLPPILPSIPMYEEAHLVEILVNHNKILENDDERTIDGKETVGLAKEELIKFISEGGSAEEFLEYYHDQLRQAHQVRQTAQQSLFQVVREEPELARDYLDRINEQLAEKGIKPLAIPPKMAERFGVDIGE